MITLLTCHPYRSHGKYRYLVFCERCTSKNKEKDSKKTTKKTVVTTKDETITYEPSTPDIKRENTIKVVAFIFILCCIAYIFVSKIRNRQSTREHTTPYFENLSVYGPAGTMSGENPNLVSFSCCKALAKAGAFCFARKNILMQRRVGYMFIEFS